MTAIGGREAGCLTDGERKQKKPRRRVRRGKK
jgi:hypothetical protein